MEVVFLSQSRAKALARPHYLAPRAFGVVSTFRRSQGICKIFLANSEIVSTCCAYLNFECDLVLR